MRSSLSLAGHPADRTVSLTKQISLFKRQLIGSSFGGWTWRLISVAFLQSLSLMFRKNKIDQNLFKERFSVILLFDVKGSTFRILRARLSRWKPFIERHSPKTVRYQVLYYLRNSKFGNSNFEWILSIGYYGTLSQQRARLQAVLLQVVLLQIVAHRVQTFAKRQP